MPTAAADEEKNGNSPAVAAPLPPAAEATPCNCFSQINEHLATYGGELLCNLFGPPRAIVSTYREPKKGGHRKKMPIVLATFCPFCGNKYPKEP